MIISAWWLLVFSIPVLMLGEFLVRKIRILERFNIPSPVVGGLLVSLMVLIFKLSGASFELQTKVDTHWWTWLVTTETAWSNFPKIDVHQPFLVAFFTCIGLNASWSLARRGSVQVLLFLGLATLLAISQNIIGIALAKVLGVSPLLGLMCGSVTMTGGHGTALGFAGLFEKSGLPSAGVLGVAAATFGLIFGGLIGGPVGGKLIHKNKLKSKASAQTNLENASTAESGILNDLRVLARRGVKLLPHLLILLVCIKAGAWVSHFLQKPFMIGAREIKMTFPVYMGAMILGLIVRNVSDLSEKKWISTEIVELMGLVVLALFLSMAMMSLNLAQLAGAAVPMLLILVVQVSFVALFAWFVTYRVMGKDFDAAVMAGGHCGFGLGATPNAVANMKSLVENFGPAPRAFLVVPIVGGFLIDLTNAFTITTFINFLK